MATKQKKRPSAKPKVSTTRASTKTSVVEPGSARSVAPKSIPDALQKLHSLSLGLYALMAIVVIYWMQSTTFPIGISHLTSDALLSQGSTVFASANRIIFDFEVRWGLAGLMAGSMILPLLYLSKLKATYADSLSKRKVLSFRWVDTAVAFAIMTEITMLFSGLGDLFNLKLAGALIAASCALGWMAESQNIKAKKPTWNTYAIGVFCGLMPWVVILASQFATVFYGAVRSPWFVYALSAVALGGLVLQGVNQVKFYQKTGRRSDYYYAERNFVVVNLITRLLFAGVLVVGLIR